ncbi:uncharacterized protein LOC114311308 isoform X3 [Camellia sinensis]|uniref:uncharacterized protein LOC114311308 isoform X3 n=1 Tax=Camellia sinensis TaxID=4442 RepID=UPI0010357FFE|nr:uncharacterized protein LOC114311308 isoform X3 [Camellia sinensis]
MESSSGLKTLNVIATTTPLHFRTGFSLFRQRHFPQLINKFNFSLYSPSSPFSPLCSLSGRGNGVCLPNGVGEALGEASPNKLLQVVLVSPQPLGFQVDDAKLKRAGLDYWPYVVVKVHDSWAEFRNYFVKQDGEKRLLAFTKRGTTIHSDFSYRRGDWLVFGSETSGLPPEVVLDCKGEEAFGFGGGTIQIPMVETYVRCLNLSVSVGIALYEASRQLNYEQLLKSSPSQTCMDAAAADNSFIAEDIFA